MKELLQTASQEEAERGPQTQPSESEVAMYEQLMSEYGVKQDDKPKRASHIAERMREKEGFDPMFKICSKIIHRTALSIASSTTRGSLDAAIPLLLSRGTSELLSIYGGIHKYVEETAFVPRRIELDPLDRAVVWVLLTTGTTLLRRPHNLIHIPHAVCWPQFAVIVGCAGIAVPGNFAVPQCELADQALLAGELAV